MRGLLELGLGGLGFGVQSLGFGIPVQAGLGFYLFIIILCNVLGLT